MKAADIANPIERAMDAQFQGQNGTCRQRYTKWPAGGAPAATRRESDASLKRNET